MVIAGKKVFLKRFVGALKFLKGRGFLRLYVDKFFSGRRWWSLCSLSSLIEVKSFSHNPERLSLSVHRLNRDRVSCYELAGAMTDKARLCTRSMSLHRYVGRLW